MERLDAQGAALRKRSLSLNQECRSIPEGLFSELRSLLPEVLEEDFRSLIVKPEFEESWKQAQLTFEDSILAILGRIDTATQKIAITTELLPRMAHDLFCQSRGLGRVACTRTNDLQFK